MSEQRLVIEPILKVAMVHVSDHYVSGGGVRK